MKKIMLLALLIVSLTACKNGSKATLVGHWETVAGEEVWDCEEDPKYGDMVSANVDSVAFDPTMDSARYRYISFDIDEDSITMLMHDRCGDPVPPLEISQLTVGYSVDSTGMVTGFRPNGWTLPLWKIVELTADKLVIKEEYDLEDCSVEETYTLKKQK